MSLTVFDVTVRSSAIIVLSLITFWLATRSRAAGQAPPLVVRVDNRPTDFYADSQRDQNLWSIGLLGLSGLVLGIVLSVILTVTAAVFVSTLTGLLGI